MLFINAIYVIVGRALDRQDLCKTGGLDHCDCLTPSTRFQLEYSIPHNTSFKDVELCWLENFYGGGIEEGISSGQASH